jgi:hypothetical protein
MGGGILTGEKLHLSKKIHLTLPRKSISPVKNFTLPRKSISPVKNFTLSRKTKQK